MRVKFWGTRGSIATPGPATVIYGGNTSCVELRCGSDILVFDAGTGLRPLGVELMSEFAGKPMTVHLAHDDVADDRRGLLLQRELDAEVSVRRGMHLPPLLGKVVRHHVEQRFVVFDDDQ